ncbi:hypothetical protein J2S23_002023 [Streptococcus moroccensis]|uniref:Uncharacterized protein n=1 Tax=Streptococcus moroccensis TaxID=1451356 RepID=A0ABT9YV25_9STRE|nr:hypothetical protein [Streptococcus moroccensis]
MKDWMGRSGAFSRIVKISSMMKLGIAKKMFRLVSVCLIQMDIQLIKKGPFLKKLLSLIKALRFV